MPNLEQHTRLAESEENFRLLVESVKDYAIFLLDEDGCIRSWNKGAEAIKQYRAEEVLGKHMSIFYTPEEKEAGRPQQLLAQALREGRVEDEGWRVRKDGTRFWADVVITPLRKESGALRGFAKVTRDLTDRMRIEEERVRRVKAEEAVRLRDEFLAIASHELRTPLTALSLGLQHVLARAAALDPAVQKNVTRAARATERLKALVESLLDISRISSGRFVLRLERFDLREAVEHGVESLSPAADSAGTKIVTALASIEGTWDRVRMEQVVMNLVGNSVKYGAGTPIEVLLRREADRAVLEVRDHGPGIPEADLHRVFGRFERAAPVRHYGGLGLGLYVTNEVVGAHGGTITARNAPDGGAHVVIHLPLERPKENE